jgi:hypothetical protein
MSLGATFRKPSHVVSYSRRKQEEPFRDERFSKTPFRRCSLPWALNRVNMVGRLWALPNLPGKAGTEDYSKPVSVAAHGYLVPHVP